MSYGPWSTITQNMGDPEYPKWSFVENEVLNHKMDLRGIMKQTWEDRQQI